MRYFILLASFFIMANALALTMERKSTAVINTSNQNVAKSFLLFEALRGVINEQGAELGIDVPTFNSKLEEKFVSYFQAYQERQMAEKFGKNFAAELAPEQKDEFLASLEKERSSLFIKSSRLEQILDSYAFKETSRDPERPEQWSGTVVLNLNQPKLIKLYKRLISPNSKQYSKLLLISEVNLIGMNWSDLELDRAATFTDPLMATWLKWFEGSSPTNVEEVALCAGECLASYERWQDLSQEEGMTVPEDLLNGVWLKVTFNLRNVKYTKGLNEWEFEWDGSVVMLDMNTKKILASYNLPEEKRVWRGLDQKTLNSKLASAMYQSPLKAFTLAVRKIQDSLRLNRLSRLVIQGQSHLGDVLDLMELLRKEGRDLNLELQLDVISRNEAQLLCFYQGEEKSFMDLLSRVKELKSSHSYNLVNEYTGVRHVLKLIAE